MAAVAARDAYYWDRPLPGVELREAQLETPVRVVVGGKTYDVKPAEALRVDAAATQQALWNAGRTSFVGRMRTIVDPSPPTRVVDQVLVARPEVDEVAARVLRRAAEAAPGAGGRPQRPRGHPRPPGRRRGRAPAGSVAREGVAHRRADAVARTDARRARADDVGGASRGRRGDLVDRRARDARVQGRGRRHARPRPAREAAPLPSRRRELPHLVPSAACRQGGRADGRAMAHPRGQRPLRRRRQAGARAALASGARCRRPLGRRRDRRRRRRACAPGVRAPEADPRRPDHPRGGEARHPPADLHVHDRHGHVVVEPDPQRAADGAVHRRHGDQARRHVLVQRPGRPAHGRARLPRGSDDHRLAAPARDRRRRLPDRDDALQQRVRARAPDRRAPQPQLLHLATTRWAATRRSPGAAPTSSSRTT